MRAITIVTEIKLTHTHTHTHTHTTKTQEAHWYTNGHFCCFDCLLTVFDCFDDWYTVGTVLVDL